MTSTKKITRYSFYAWLFIFVVMPLGLIVVDSFLDLNGNFSLSNYQTFFSDVYIKMTLNSFVYAGLITIISLIFAYPAAICLHRSNHGKLFLILLIIPSWINLLLKTYAFMGILGTEGLINKILGFLAIPPGQFLFNLTGFLIVSIYIFIPYMIFPLYNTIEQIPKSYINAATDLGANKFQVFRKVILPLSKEGIFSAIQIVFIPSLSLFMITRLIAGNKIITLGTAIEEHFMVTGNWPMGSAIGTILIVIMIGMMIISLRLNKRGRSTGREL